MQPQVSIVKSNNELKILQNTSKRCIQSSKRNIVRRLYERTIVNPLTNCWEWTGSLSKFGHARIGYRDKILLGHRLSYEIHNGQIPKGLQVNHKCDNAKCINPEHLFIGTQKDNMHDAIKKGRNFHIPAMPGETNPLAKLTNNQVKQIRKKIKNGYTGLSLSKEYNVSTTIISRIKLGKTYKDSICL